MAAAKTTTTASTHSLGTFTFAKETPGTWVFSRTDESGRKTPQYVSKAILADTLTAETLAGRTITVDIVLS